MSAIQITHDNFENTLNQNDIVVLDFWASWCGPCRMFGPIFEKVSNKHPEIVFGKIDTEAQQELAKSFQIRSIPTLMVFRKNILLFSQAGILQENALDDLIEQIKTLDMDKIEAEIDAEEAKTT